MALQSDTVKYVVNPICSFYNLLVPNTCDTHKGRYKPLLLGTRRLYPISKYVAQTAHPFWAVGGHRR
jgi:hypothetical protein